MDRPFSALHKQLQERFPSVALHPIDRIRRCKLERSHPGLPQDYLDYLENVGWCANQIVWYRIFDGPCGSTGLYDARVRDQLKTVLFFGGDYQGRNDGFDMANDYGIVKVDGTGGIHIEPMDPELAFTEFIGQRWSELYDAFLTEVDE